MPSKFYTLLWVEPEKDAKNVPTLEQLDVELGNVYASVIDVIPEEHKILSQKAIRLSGRADEATVRAKLADHHYTVVHKKICEDPQGSADLFLW